MSASLASDLAMMLRNAGLVNVYDGQFPATPDEIVTVRATGGLAPLETHGDEVYSRPRAQVIVRSKTQAVASANALIAWHALRKIRNAVIKGTRYLSVKPLDGIADLGTDEQNPPRRLATFNVQVIRAED